MQRDVQVLKAAHWLASNHAAMRASVRYHNHQSSSCAPLVIYC